MKVLSLAAVAAFCMGLVGCVDGAPGNEEIRQTWENHYKTFFGRRAVVSSVENTNCSKAEGKPGYMCNFTFNSNVGGQGSEEARFIKEGDSWSVRVGFDK